MWKLGLCASCRCVGALSIDTGFRELVLETMHDLCRVRVESNLDVSLNGKLLR